MSTAPAEATPQIVEQTREFPIGRVVQAVIAIALIALLMLDIFPPIKPVAFAALVVLAVVVIVGLLDQFAPARVTDTIATGLIWLFAVGIVALLASFLVYIILKGFATIGWSGIGFLLLIAGLIAAGAVVYFVVTRLPPETPGLLRVGAALGAVIVAVAFVALLANLIGRVIPGFPGFLDTSPPGNPEGVVGPQLWNSFYLLIVTMILSIPLGVGAGIYMAEFAPVNRFTEGIRLATETLASLPSIIVGLFGLVLFVNTLGLRFSVLAGALALSVFNLPLIERVTEQSLRSVPASLREGALGLGMTRWQAIRTVVLPSAIPGLVTGFILAAGRVFGEAATLLFTAGQSTAALNWSDLSLFSNTSPLGLLRPAESLSVHIWKLQSEGIVPNYRNIADGAAALLIVSVLLFNVVARYLGRVLYRRITASR